jgi:hypothetical protein
MLAQIWFKNVKEKGHSEDLSVYGKILKLIITEKGIAECGLD